MSRLFENLGDGADETEKPFGSPLMGEPGEVAPEPAVGAGQDDLGALDAFLPPGVRGVAADDDEVPALAPMPGEPTAPARPGPLLLNDDPAPPATLAEIAPHSAYEIPDFEKDARDLDGYEDAKRRHQRQQLASAETAIQTSFGQKRETLQREIKNGRTFEEERRATAMVSTRAYANAYPIHVDKRGIQPPTFFENLFSFGRAGRLYRAAFVAAEALDQLRQAMRKREEQLAQLDDGMKRALYLKEEAIKKSMESESGLNDFHERPEIKPLYKRIEKIKREREEYAKRLDKGKVGDEEQRDRAMGEQKLSMTTLPIMGAIIAKVARFGNLSYFQLRDLEKKESLLSYDPRLDPLRNCVFDIYAVAGTVAAKLRRNDNGTAFRVADHFKACWRNQEKAEELYGQHRAALREDRGLMPIEPANPGEAEIIERLAALSSMVDGGGGSKSFSDSASQGASASQ